MKRKKQVSEHETQEPTIKRLRSDPATPQITDNGAQGMGSKKISPRGKLNIVEAQEMESLFSSELSDRQNSIVSDVEDELSELKGLEPVAIRTPVKVIPDGLDDGSTTQIHAKTATPSRGLLNKKLFSTPVKTNGPSGMTNTPTIERNSDRSARRKSTRNFIERTILGNTSDNDEEEVNIARHIYDSGDEEDVDADEITGQTIEEPSTPSKRGRPRGSKNRRRSPTPPQDLENHEKYFFHNRGGRAKTSNNDLSSLALLDHEEYFSRSRNITDPHEDDINFLEQWHAQSFNQWRFELSQDFNICVYGYGSKRALLMKFADYVYHSQPQNSTHKIVVVNGYVNNLTVRDVLNTVASVIAERGQKLGSQPTDMLENVMALLELDKSQSITLIIHSIDRIPLRRATTQTILSRLSAHPQIHLIASADHPSFPLLWDSSLRSTYNFVFHDCTTFQAYNAEVDVVDEVHDILGRSGRRVGGKEGVSFVLKSLPENAKNLFKILIGEQLAAMEEHPAGELDDYDDGNEQRTANLRHTLIGVEYRTLYQKAVEEFICSNEMNFRTLLKEFHDHQMIQSRKDGLGTELLSVPFRKEELEAILEDVSS